MNELQKMYYDKRGPVLVKNLQSRHFDAFYCSTKEEALEKALSLIPRGHSVGWGGTMTCQQIGLIDAVRAGEYRVFDRDACKTVEEREGLMRQTLLCDTFLTSANAISLDGQMVNIDGNGNREAAINRARTGAAPLNEQRFGHPNPCAATGSCADCKSETCICNQILITRHCRGNRIKFVLVGEDLGL